LKFAFSRLISLNFASLLGKISAQQASKDTSTEAHTHKTQNNLKTLQNTIFNASKPSRQRKLATNIYLSTQNQSKRTF
jgi:hypothetical protein